VAAESLRRGLPLAETDLVNVFDRNIGAVAPPLASAMATCRQAGLAVHALGSGPGFFAFTALEDLPQTLLRELRQEWGVRAVGAMTIPRDEALRMRES